MKLVLLCVIIACALAQQALPICIQNTDCNSWATTTTQRCEMPLSGPKDAICQGRNTYQFGSSNSDPKGMCTGSLDLSGGSSSSCGQLASVGCTVGPSTACTGSFFNGVTKTCDAFNASTTIYVGNGQRCNAAATPQIACGQGLQCYLNVCRPQLQLGDNCAGEPILCGPGLTCDGDLCVGMYSKIAQDPCHTSLACAQGTCTLGRCAEQRSIPCFSNSDCAGSNDGLCYIAAGSVRGYCTNGYMAAQAKLQQCLRLAASGIQSTPTDATAVCVTEQVRVACIGACNAREDQRVTTDGYTYNCQALTRTKIAPNTCAIRVVYSACDTIPLSASFTQVLSIAVVFVCALITLA